MTINKGTLIKLAIKLFSFIPFTLAQGLGKTLGWLFWWVPTSSKRVIQTNLALCFPDLPKPRQQHLGHQCMTESMCMLMEISAFWIWPLDRLDGFIKTIKHEDYLQAQLAKPQGTIVLIPHYGAWEGAQMYFCGRHHGTVMYREPKIKALSEFLHQMRSRYPDNEFVHADKHGVKQFYTRLKQGGAVLMLPDQVPSSRHEILAPFFGVQAQTMRFLFRLIQKTQANVVFMIVKRLGVGKGFDIEFIDAPKALYDENEQIAATALNATIETIIRKAPEQYQWTYKRFKHAAPDGKDYYR